MTSHKLKFLEKAFLGREIDFDNSDEIIYRCVTLAYRDMLSAGRYYLSGNMEERCQSFIKILKAHNYIFSREIIDDTLPIFGENENIGKGNRYVTRYGLSQKLVNMTYKYLYIFPEHISFTIDFSHCDCPLDSIILKNIKSADTVCSKLTKEKYIVYQNEIYSLLNEEVIDDELIKIGNIAYDFINW